ncbi:MAG: hypothetical protein HY921_01210 [Elusimicrobia bacterium]|nr:hypothetical protein [Elusimicrobiota bacterium]
MAIPTETKSFLLCAATAWEARPLAKSLGLGEAEGALRSGILAGGAKATLLRTGMGPGRAAVSLEALKAEDFSMVLSVGLAGALQPGLKSGDLVADLQGCDLQILETMRAAAYARSAPIYFGRVLHSDRILCEPGDKSDLGRRERAIAVDMESAAIRAWAGRRGVASLVLRAVLDEVEDRLPSEPPVCESWSAGVAYLARHPAQAPWLVSLGLKQKKALKALAAFLAELLGKL